MATSTATEIIHLSTLPKTDNLTLSGVYDRAAMIQTSPVIVDESPRASMSREAGERDPLLLRGKIMGEGELNELRQCVDIIYMPLFQAGK